MQNNDVIKIEPESTKEHHQFQPNGWHFSQALVDLVLDNKVSPQEMVILGMIDNLTKRHGRTIEGCYASNAWIMRHTNITNKKSISNMISRLREMGLVNCYFDRGKRKRYLTVTYNTNQIDIKKKRPNTTVQKHGS